jgi:hypothetical protein
MVLKFLLQILVINRPSGKTRLNMTHTVGAVDIPYSLTANHSQSGVILFTKGMAT